MTTTSIPIRKFTVEEFYRLGEVGILTEDDRVELLEGSLVEMPPIGGPHANSVDKLSRFFSRGLGDGAAWIRVQNPVHLSSTPPP